MLCVLAMAGVVLGGMVGCGGSDDPPKPTAPIATETPPPDAVAGAADSQALPATQVVTGGIVWAAAVEIGTNRPVDEVTEFDATSPAIYAALPVSAAPLGATLTATWTYNETAIQGMDASVQLPEVRSEPIWVEFHLERLADVDWPDGRYEITVRDGERVVAQSTVDVGPEQ